MEQQDKKEFGQAAQFDKLARELSLDEIEKVYGGGEGTPGKVGQCDIN